MVAKCAAIARKVGALLLPRSDMPSFAGSYDFGRPAFAGARQEFLQGRGDRRAKPDLLVGSGSYEIARQVLCKTPDPNTIIGSSSFDNHGSGES